MLTVEDRLLEGQLDFWRRYLARKKTVSSAGVADEPEDQLREEVDRLTGGGLTHDEAFLVAVKRLGIPDSLSREFSREQSGRLWRQPGTDALEVGKSWKQFWNEAGVVFALALWAAVLIKLPELFGVRINRNPSFHLRNMSLFVLPLLTGYLVWKRGLSGTVVRWLIAAFVAAAVFANIYPFSSGGNTEVLAVLHMPIALWMGVMGVAYAGSRWNTVEGRMEFLRFTGELIIYYVLMALGAAVFTTFVEMLFSAIGINLEPFYGSWVLPCGAMGGVLVAAWLAEARRGLIDIVAPVLTRLLTPLFTLLMVAFLVTLAVTGRGVNIERDMLIAFDFLLVVVLALQLYSISARLPDAAPGVFDYLQVALVISALLVDLVVLMEVAIRVGEGGFTPNRIAALGMNIILLANLAWSAVLYIRFLRGRGAFAELEEWQTGYLPVYAAWAAVVVVVFPPLFGFG